MAIIKRSELQTAFQENSPLLASQFFLFFGERFLCKEAADLVQSRLLPKGAGAVNPIDGDHEDPGKTLSRLMSYSLLPGRQLFRVTDSRIFHTKTVVGEIWAKAVQAFQGGHLDSARKHLRSMVQAVGLKIEGPTTLAEIPRGNGRIFLPLPNLVTISGGPTSS